MVSITSSSIKIFCSSPSLRLRLYFPPAPPPFMLLHPPLPTPSPPPSPPTLLFERSLILFAFLTQPFFTPGFFLNFLYSYFILSPTTSFYPLPPHSLSYHLILSPTTSYSHLPPHCIQYNFILFPTTSLSPLTPNYIPYHFIYLFAYLPQGSHFTLSSHKLPLWPVPIFLTLPILILCTFSPLILPPSVYEVNTYILPSQEKRKK